MNEKAVQSFSIYVFPVRINLMIKSELKQGSSEEKQQNKNQWSTGNKYGRFETIQSLIAHKINRQRKRQHWNRDSALSGSKRKRQGKIYLMQNWLIHKMGQQQNHKFQLTL